jgi:outer membrane receptor protein involved in Fe transport
MPLALALLAPSHPGSPLVTPSGERSAVTSSVRGTVLEHETGAPLAGATISLTSDRDEGGDPGSRVSDDSGQFLFEDVQPRRYSIAVTRIGYRTFSDTLVVVPESDIRIVVELSPAPIALEAVVVVVNRSPMMAGFEARRRRARGTFITRDEIEATNPAFVSDLLRTVPGATFVRRRMGNLEIRMRGGCRPTVWVNGGRAIDASVSEIGIDQILSPYEVEAVEVYRGAGAVPAQFGPEACGAIVIWTRQGPPEPVEGSSWKRIVVAVGVVVGILLAR